MKWEKVFVETLTKIVTKGTTPTSVGYQFVDEGIPFLRVNNIQGGDLDISDVLFINNETDAALKRSRILPNDVLISIAGTIGRSAVVPENAPSMNCNQAIAIIRLQESANPYYFRYWLNSQEAVNQISNSKVTATISNLSLGCINKLKISLPPLEEQKRIAEILDKADRVRRKRQEAIRLTEELGRSIFLDMFGDLFAFLTGKQKHDKGFLYCKLGDQITLQRGFDLLKKDCTEGIYPVISSGGIHTYHDQYKAKGPGVLLGRKGSVGRVHYVEDNYWPHDTTLWIKFFNNNNPVFVYHFFKLFPILRFEASTASPTLNRNRLHPLQVFWPDKELQTKFANSISVINKYEDGNNSHFSQSENLFNSLLQRAFRGEL